LNNKLQ